MVYYEQQRAGQRLFVQARKSGDLATLDRAIALFREAALRWPTSDRERALVLENLGGSLRTRYELTGTRADLDDAIDSLRQAAARIPARRRAKCLSELGVALRLRESGDDLDEAVRTQRKAVAAASHETRPGYQERLALALSTRARRTGSAPDFEESITLHRQAARDPGTAALALSNLGEALLGRAVRLGSATDLDAAVDALRGSLRHERSAQTLGLLGGALLTRFRHSGEVRDLDESIESHRAAVCAAVGARAVRRQQSGLAEALQIRFEQNGDPAVLDEAEQTIRSALALDSMAAEDHEYAEARATLGSVLAERYQRSGAVEVIEEAIAALKAAVAGLDPSRSNYVDVVSNLVGALASRSRYTGTTRDLDRAIELLRTTGRDTPSTHAQRGFHLVTHGHALVTRFKHLGALTDLNDAIDKLRDAVPAFSPGHPHQVHARCELAEALTHRSAHTGSSADLQEALDHLEAALADLPERHPSQPVVLSGLSAVLHRMNRLDDALDAMRQAIALVPEDDHQRANLFLDLGTLQLAKAGVTENPSNLGTAIGTLRRAATALAGEHDPRHRAGLSRLGSALAIKATLVDSERDLDEAITTLRGATDSPTPEAAPLIILGQALHARFRLTGDHADLSAALDCWRHAASMTTEPAGARIQAALDWALAATDAEQWEAIVPACSAVIELLTLLAWRGLDRGDQERLLAERFGVTSFAAAAVLAAGHPERALELLEHGRGVLWSQILDLRTDLAQARAAAPELAERLEQIRTELDRTTQPLETMAGTMARDVERSARRRDLRTRLAKEWDDLAAEIRLRPGHADFLRPPRFADLRDRAPETGTTVVVNVASLRCDAFCLSRDGLRVVPLPDLSLADAVEHGNQLLQALRTAGFEELQRTLTEILRWLWHTTARPVLDALGHKPRARPNERVWWCPAGPMSMFPIHAAGEHAAQDSVFERVISSYTPTLRALPGPRPATSSERLLIVSMPETPGQRPLPGAAQETDTLLDRFGEITTVLKGPQATHAAVSAALPEYPVVHFACHGQQNPAEPSTAALLVHDRPLTVLDIADMHLAHGELAFLSACQTAFGGVHLLDESIHLAASLRLAGYRNVIGTLWPITDKTAATVAYDVYTRLFHNGTLDTRHTADALRESIVGLRNAEPANPSRWAPYIHLG